ncbi:MAG: YHS domain-containing (seleno)protein [Ferruginibacter sp.]
MKLFSISLLALITCTACYAQDVKYYNNKGTAINGYDPVAYFLQNKAVTGTDIYSMDWSGSKWKFNSQASLDSFKLAPEKYAPQYGGYCAYGCSENHKAPTDPNAFTIVGNKLYLNYSLKVKEFWLKDTVGKIKAADGYWPALNK